MRKRNNHQNQLKLKTDACGDLKLKRKLEWPNEQGCQSSLNLVRTINTTTTCNSKVVLK